MILIELDMILRMLDISIIVEIFNFIFKMEV